MVEGKALCPSGSLLTEPTGREVCGYLLVRSLVHAHAPYPLWLGQFKLMSPKA